MIIRHILSAIVLLAGTAFPVIAQDKGTLNPKPLPPIKKITAETPAKDLFGRQRKPADLQAQPVGFYSKGCLAGADMMPHDGQNWQVMRPSRNRNWGHPNLVAFLKKFAGMQPKTTGWPGLLIGDMSQPRGGPMLTGHASHQIGLDVDVWLMPMPNRILTRKEREETSAINVVRADRRDIDPDIWTESHTALIRAAAQEPQVERIFVNPAIKRALCREAGSSRKWLRKVRPTWGHNYHFHIRFSCPANADFCTPQALPPVGDGCGKELDWWFSDAVLNPKPSKKPPAKKKPLVMGNLPPLCRTILEAP